MRAFNKKVLLATWNESVRVYRLTLSERDPKRLARYCSIYANTISGRFLPMSVFPQAPHDVAHGWS